MPIAHPDDLERRRWDLLALVALVGVGVALPLVVGAVAGSVLIPHNDDPAMRRSAQMLFETGRLQLVGWTAMTLIGQLLFVQPFLWVTSGGPWAFALATATLTVIGIVASYRLVRRIVSIPRATLSVLALLVFPPFLVNTTTFMTDVPAWAASMGCLALGAAAMSRSGAGRWRWLAAALVVGCFAFSIREFTIAAPAAVLASAMASDWRNTRRYLVAGILFVAGCALVYVVARSLPGQRIGLANNSLGITIERLRLGFATLALVLSPAVAIAIATRARSWRRADCLAGGILGLVIVLPSLITAIQTRHVPRLLVGNVLEQTGALGTSVLSGGRPVLFPTGWWSLLNAVALLAVIALVAVLGGMVGGPAREAIRDLRSGRVASVLERIGSTTGLLTVFVVLSAAIAIGFGLAVVTFDRYVIVFVVPMSALLLRPPTGAAAVEPPRASRAHAAGWMVSGALVAVLSLTSVVLLLNGAAYDAARWRLGEAGIALGDPADRIDAGLEWYAYHATGMAAPMAPADPPFSRYVPWWPPSRVCLVGSASPLKTPGWELVSTDPNAYRQLLVLGRREPLYLYRVPGVDCS